MRIIAALGISLLLLVGLVSPVLAGVEPSPFRVKQLNAVANRLEALDVQLNALFHPPDPCMPPPDDGVPTPEEYSGMLVAMAGQLEFLYERVDAAMPPPDDNTPAVEAAMTNVRDTAQSIVDTLVGPPPDDNIPADALAGVESGAQAIVDLAKGYLSPLSLID